MCANLPATLLSHIHTLIITTNLRTPGRSDRDRIPPAPNFADKETDFLFREGNRETWPRPRIWLAVEVEFASNLQMEVLCFCALVTAPSLAL